MKSPSLSAIARSKMKEKTLVSLNVKNGIKLNLLIVGSDFLPFPIYLIRNNRKEIFKSLDYKAAGNYFLRYCQDNLDLLFNELPFPEYIDPELPI